MHHVAVQRAAALRRRQTTHPPTCISIVLRSSSGRSRMPGVSMTWATRVGRDTSKGHQAGAFQPLPTAQPPIGNNPDTPSIGAGVCQQFSWQPETAPTP